VPDDKGSTKVEIYGQDYRISGDADPEFMAEIARYVDSKMKEVAKGAPLGSLSKIAILGALNIAEELFKERDEKNRILSGIEAATSRMKEKLEEITP
jgi:cell division protein ZapA